MSKLLQVIRFGSAIIILLFLNNPIALARELYLDISINNATENEIAVSYPENLLLEEIKTYKIPIKDNSIYTIVQIENYPTITIQYGTTKFEVFVEGLDKIQCSFEASSPLSTLQFEGDAKAKNEPFLNTQQSNNAPDTIINKGFVFVHLSSHDLKNATTVNNFDEFMQSLSEPATNSNAFINAKARYRYYISLLTYFMANQSKLSTTDIQKITQNTTIFNEIAQPATFDDKWLTMPEYVNFIQTYMYYMYLKGSSTGNSDLAMYEIAAKHLQDETRTWMLCKILLNAKAQKNDELARKKFFSLKQSSPYKQYIKTVENAYGNELSFDPDGAAPNFTLINDAGQEVSLSDYKGRVIYISFWATWCRPCLANFTRTEGIRHQMLDKGVVLINVSLDSNESTWRRTMLRVPMPGINLFASADTLLKLKYDLSRLPSYYIVDKKGNFAYLPEGARNILDEFEKLVNE